MNVRVRFRDQELWWLKHDDSPYGPLAPLHHCDDEGYVKVMGESFAHVYEDGSILRFNTKIGTIDDLEILY